METIKDYLGVCSTEGYVRLINDIIGDIYDNESGERIFDLDDKYERADFAELYGWQTTERLHYGKPNEKGNYTTHRWFIGGDNYYANIEDKTAWRCVPVRELTEEEIYKLLIENYLHDWEEKFKGTLTADGEDTIGEIVEDWEKYYAGLIYVFAYYEDVLSKEFGISKK